MFPVPSTNTVNGLDSSALTAEPPSPLNPAVPVPATVWIVRLATPTSRIRLLPESAMKMFPDPSTKTPSGKFSCALVAGPPSPQDVVEDGHATPVPATVLMSLAAKPTGGVQTTAVLVQYTSRMTLLVASAM